MLVDLSPAMLALAPRPAVLAEGARLPVFLRCHGMGVAAAPTAAATLDPPLTLTMRCCTVYAIKG